MNKIIFPEPLFSEDLLSFSSFLFFNNQTVYSTLPPTVSISLTKCNPFEFMDIIKEKKPVWCDDFEKIFYSFLLSTQLVNKTLSSLNKLKNNGFGSMLLSYSRTTEKLENIIQFIKNSGKSIDELYKIIYLPMAEQEFISHILFEKYLEFYQNESNVDYLDLYNYLDILIQKFSIKLLLVACYFFRMDFQDYDGILLTNPNLLSLYSELPIKLEKTLSYL